MQLSDINPVLIPTLPVILAPIVAWFLSRSGISKQVSTIDYLNKRLDILERLNKLHAELKEAPIRPFLDTEIEHCRAYLRQPVTFIARDVAADAEMAAERTAPKSAGEATAPKSAGEATAPLATVEITAPRATAPQSRVGRFFLTRPSASTRKRVYKGLFYFFFGTSVLSLFALAGVFAPEASSEKFARFWGVLFIFLFYFIISLLFRRAAR